MAIRQTRIFVPSADIGNDWAETLIGRVIAPATAAHQASLPWFWFSRYIDAPNAGGDTDINLIPANYKVGQHKSIRFRFEVLDADQAVFEQELTDLINNNGYAISDIRDYDKVADTGNHRFLGTENRLPGRDTQRADLVTEMYQSVSKLVIDALVGPDAAGRYRVETNDNAENPDHSTFQSLMHLFCNISAVPAMVILRVEDAYGISVNTYWSPHSPVLPIGWRGNGRYPVQF